MATPTLDNEWRKVAAAVYRKPADSKIFGSVEIDVTDLEAYVSQVRKEGVKITLTHIFTLIVARALKHDVPELNCYIRRGKVMERKQVDAMVSVLVDDRAMSSVRIEQADRLTLQELAETLNEGIRQTRQGNENRTMRSKGWIARIPWPFRTWIFHLVKQITITWGMSIPALGLTPDSFGSFVITNIGTLGLDTGYPALFPVSNVAMVFVMGGVAKKPVVVDNRVVIRRMLSLSCALDHRVVDAQHGGHLFRCIRQAVRHPETLEVIRP